MKPTECESEMYFESEGVLSFWIGHFDGEDDLFEYVDFRYDEAAPSTDG